MKQYIILGVGLLCVLFVSGCTDANIQGQTVQINNLEYDTFMATLSTHDCDREFEFRYPDEDDYTCYITSVNLDEMRYNCECEIKGLI